MTVHDLRAYIRAVPFVPFVIHLGDGHAVTVQHPEFVAMSPSGLSVTVYEEDRTHLINTVQITRITTRDASGVA